MILFSVSLPGRFGEWCDAVIARLAERVLGPVVSSGANTAEELASELVTTGGQHFYVGARQPSRWLRDKLTTTNKNFVVAVDDPRNAASDLILRHQLDAAEATRRVACSCAAISRFITLPGALLVRAERDWLDPAATVAALARHLGLPVDAADIEKIAADVAAIYPQPGDAPEAASAAQLPEHSLAVVDGALTPYVEYFTGAALRHIIWARDLFFEEHHQPAVQPIDVSGKIRYLIYGPYIALPPGNWVAEIVLAFSEDAVDMNFQIEVWAGSQLSKASVKPSGPGLLQVNISFALEEMNDNLLEIRVMNERAAIFGRLALGQATITLLQNVSSQVVDTLTTELGLLPDASNKFASNPR